MRKIKLGDKVKDTISDFEGIATAEHRYLHGCRRITVSPKSKNGSVPDDKTFDEPQLELIESSVVKGTENDNGGSDKYVDKGKSLGKR